MASLIPSEDKWKYVSRSQSAEVIPDDKLKFFYPVQHSIEVVIVYCSLSLMKIGERMQTESGWSPNMQPKVSAACISLASWSKDLTLRSGRQEDIHFLSKKKEEFQEDLGGFHVLQLLIFL